MASRNHELENTSAETKPRVPPRPHLFFSNEIRRRRRMYEPVKNSPVPRRAVNPWNNGTGATLDKSGNVVHSRPSRRRDLAGYIFPRDAGARVRVPYVCRVYGKRRSWMVEGGGGGGYTRGGLEGGRAIPIQRRTWTWKEAKIDLPAAYLADTRFIRSSRYFPLPPPLGVYTWTVRFSPWVGSEGMEVSWKKGAGIIV